MKTLRAQTLVHLLIALLTSLGFSVRAQVPQILSYQGRVAVGGVNFPAAGGSATGNFKFALVSGDGSTTYWSNDGATPPVQEVPLTVTNGLYSVLLGDTTVANMSAVPVSVFSNQGVFLRIWFDDGQHGAQQLSPDQRIATVAYAVAAGTAASVSNGAITAASLAPGSVTTTAIAAGAVTGAQIANGSVSQGQLAAVTTGQFKVATGGLAMSPLVSVSPAYTADFAETPLTNAEVSLTVSGRPVELSFLTSPSLPAGSPTRPPVGAFYIQAGNDSIIFLVIRFYRTQVNPTTGVDVPNTQTLVQLFSLQELGASTAGAQNAIFYPPTTVRCFDTGTTPGTTYHYTVTIEGTGLMNPTYDTVGCENVVLMAKEL